MTNQGWKAERLVQCADSRSCAETKRYFIFEHSMYRHWSTIFSILCVLGCEAKNAIPENASTHTTRGSAVSVNATETARMTPFLMDTPSENSSGWAVSDGIVSALHSEGIACQSTRVMLASREFVVDRHKFQLAKKLAVDASKMKQTTIRVKSEIDSDYWETYVAGVKTKTESYVFEDSKK